MRPKITHVAIKYNGKVYSLRAPNRHHHLIGVIMKDNPDITHVDGEVQGFLDEEGTFLNRRQALISADMNGQIKDPNKVYAGMLTSENVW